MLDDLVAVITTLKKRIEAHGPALRENEIRTRMALIDPLLKVLGWDTSDPAMVLPEYDVSGRKADYALLGCNGNPSATVEAKKLGEPLASHRMQMLNYSNASGVEYAGLTDGDKWELYEVFKRGQLEERRALDVSIANTPAPEAALKLLLLWRPNLASGQPVEANEPVLVRPDKDPLKPVPDDELIDPDWVPLISITNAKGDKKPTGIRFNRTSPEKITSWRQVLINTAEWLCREERLTNHNCPIGKEGKSVTRHLVSTNTIHKNGVGFAAPHRTSTGLFVETSHSSASCLDHTKLLMDAIGIPPDTVELRFE